MEDKQKIQLMMETFVHPHSSFAEQKFFAEDYTTKSGRTYKKGTHFFTRREGRCTHTPRHTKPRECPDYHEAEFTVNDLLDHLNGKVTYAPYQISKDEKVKWICLDVDAYDAPDETIKERVVEVVRRVQGFVGPRHALVEKSGSKGFHVWVFFDRAIHVSYAHAFAHQIVSGLGNNTSLIVEVYPKQQSSSGLGHTVKLPLGIHQKTGERCFFVNSRFEFYEDQWEALASVNRVSADWVESNIEPSTIQEDLEDKPSDKPRYAPLCLTDILNNGCGEGIRDEAAFRLSCYLRDKGLKEKYTRMILEDWNSENHPPLDDTELDTKIQSSYNRNYPWRPCRIPGFDPYCHSACHYFKGKVEQRWHTKDKSPVGEISRD